ncbi:hypothetical protein LIA77_08657 [Sarocladium implicatum]|nr:hypothetical protein LIA77_08657 [Sarocladium implicatum]
MVVGSESFRGCATSQAAARALHGGAYAGKTAWLDQSGQPWPPTTWHGQHCSTRTRGSRCLHRRLYAAPREDAVTILRRECIQRTQYHGILWAWFTGTGCQHKASSHRKRHATLD